MITVPNSRQSQTGQLVLRANTRFDEAAVGRVLNAHRSERRPTAGLFAESDDDDYAAGARLAKELGSQMVRAD